MDAKYLDQAMELVKAQAAVKAMTPAEMIAMRDELAIALAGDAIVVPDSEAGPACDPKGAIKERSITCLICGKQMKVITAKHLASHDTTPQEYRAKFGYKKNQPLACKALSRERKNRMKDIKLWERRQKPAKTETPAEVKSKPKKSPEATA